MRVISLEKHKPDSRNVYWDEDRKKANKQKLYCRAGKQRIRRITIYVPLFTEEYTKKRTKVMASLRSEENKKSKKIKTIVLRK